MTITYCTTLEVFEYLQWVKQIPNYPSSTTLESVDTSGTLANSSKIYLDHGKVIKNTQTISYGTSATSVTSLVETDDYSINLDIGEITITTAGAVKIGTDTVYAAYKYNDFTTDSYVEDLIERKEEYLIKKTEKEFGTLTLVEREEHTGKGAFQKVYFTDERPANLIKTQLASNVTASATAFEVDSTTGFTATDYGTIGDEVYQIVTVTSATALEVTRAKYGTTGAAHSSDDWTINSVVETSNTQQGAVPIWKVQSFRSRFDTDSDTGAIQLFYVNSVDGDSIGWILYPLHHIFNRFRITYTKGSLTVPEPITHLTILLVVKSMMNSTLGKSHIQGIDGFNPTGYEEIDKEIKEILGEYNKLIIGYA